MAKTQSAIYKCVDVLWHVDIIFSEVCGVFTLQKVPPEHCTQRNFRIYDKYNWHKITDVDNSLQETYKKNFKGL